MLSSDANKSSEIVRKLKSDHKQIIKWSLCLEKNKRKSDFNNLTGRDLRNIKYNEQKNWNDHQENILRNLPCFLSHESLGVSCLIITILHGDPTDTDRMSTCVPSVSYSYFYSVKHFFPLASLYSNHEQLPVLLHSSIKRS